MKQIVLIVLGVTLLLVMGCKKTSDDCFEVRPTAGFLIDYPDSVKVSVPFLLTINYVVDNNCGDFESVEGVRDQNTLELKLKAGYKGCNCTSAFEKKETIYPITFEKPATYTLKLWVAEEQYDTYVVVAY